MEKRGPKPKGKVKLEWSADFAYAVGLLASDGNLSKDGRHIIITSKDIELIEHFQKALTIQTRIQKKASQKGAEKKYFVTQFSDVLFYKFLLRIGITPNKSKTIAVINVPAQFFFDFLRGSFDGDGSFYSYWDKRWKSSFVFYTVFASASKAHIDWIKNQLDLRLRVYGHITKDKEKTVYQLKYAKKESLKILKNMYYSGSAISLSRKREKIESAIRVANHSIDAQVEKLVDSLP
jgi:hypothetical protein